MSAAYLRRPEADTLTGASVGITYTHATTGVRGPRATVGLLEGGSVGSSKRAREVARAKAERQAARRAEAAQRRRRRNQIISVVAVLVVIAGGVAWFAVNRSSDTSVAPADAPTDVPTDVPSPEAPSPDAPSPDVPSEAPSDLTSPSGVPSPESSAAAAELDCRQPKATRPDDLSWDAAPDTSLKATTDYTMTLVTNCGDIEIALEPQGAPVTTASMAFLADEGYFDLTACHRLTTEGIYVLQCGDPKGDGTGGPGYSIPDENLPAEGADNYPAGTVAMANAGPGTGGSQFFIVYENTTLPSGYTIWGKVTSGLDVVRGIASAGVEGGGSDGPPAQPVIIEKATVTPAQRG